MSLKNRAKALAKKQGTTYQQARSTLRDLGPEPSIVSERLHWPLQRADAYCVDPDLDPEYAEVSRSARYVNESSCENCEKGYFEAFDKKGIPVGGSNRHCPECIEEYGTWECPRCGCEILGTQDEESVMCSNCWDHLMEKD